MVILSFTNVVSALTLTFTKPYTWYRYGGTGGQQAYSNINGKLSGRTWTFGWSFADVWQDFYVEETIQYPDIEIKAYLAYYMYSTASIGGYAKVRIRVAWHIIEPWPPRVVKEWVVYYQEVWGGSKSFYGWKTLTTDGTGWSMHPNILHRIVVRFETEANAGILGTAYVQKYSSGSSMAIYSFDYTSAYIKVFPGEGP